MNSGFAPDSAPDSASQSNAEGALQATMDQMGLKPNEVAVVLVDHGSRRDESNRLLGCLVDSFRKSSGFSIVEAAHMELAEPSISTAFRRVVEQGAKLVVASPYFLSPGRHWNQDIPALFRQAAREFPGTRFLVTAPLGLHPLMQTIIQDRITHCLQHAVGAAERCDVCADEAGGCSLQTPVDEKGCTEDGQ